MCSLERSKAFEFFRELDAETKLFEKNMSCMVDLTATCKEPSIRSHSISSTNLRLIAEAGNLKTLEHNPYTDDPEDTIRFSRAGINKASTFPGFCAKHDNDLFAEIDSKSFELNESSLSRYFYRCIAQELYKKTRILIQMGDFWILDDNYKKTRPEDLDAMLAGFELGVRDLYAQILEINEALVKADYSNIRYFSIELDCILPFAFVSPLNFQAFPYYGIFDMDIENAQPSVMCACIPMSGGTMLSFCWTRGADKTLNPLLKRIEYARGHLPEFFLQFGLEHFENIFFRPSWIDAWTELQKDRCLDVFRNSVIEEPPALHWRPLFDLFQFEPYSASVSTNSSKIRMWLRQHKVS